MPHPGRFNPKKGVGTNCIVRTVGMVLRDIGPVSSHRLRSYATCSSARTMATTAYVSPSNTHLVCFHSFSSCPPPVAYLLSSFAQFLRYSFINFMSVVGQRLGWP
jgi:hypothetical protein